MVLLKRPQSRIFATGVGLGMGLGSAMRENASFFKYGDGVVDLPVSFTDEMGKLREKVIKYSPFGGLL